jgi:hypothetical protein
MQYGTIQNDTLQNDHLAEWPFSRMTLKNYAFQIDTQQNNAEQNDTQNDTL